MEALLVVIAVAGMFLLLIAPHEGGHFALAKLFKVRVIEFSIGAGTKLCPLLVAAPFTRSGSCPSWATSAWAAWRPTISTSPTASPPNRRCGGSRSWPPDQ